MAGKIEAVLAKHPELELAYLFGSRAGGHAGPDSDYDFAILIDEARDLPALRAQMSYELGSALGTDKIDIVILNQAAIELAYAVVAQGMLVFERTEATRVEFEAGVMGRYGDYLPVLRAQRTDIYRGGGHAARVHRYREALRRTERQTREIGASKNEAAG